MDKFKNYKFTTLEEGLKKYFIWINKLDKRNIEKSHPYDIDKNFKL